MQPLVYFLGMASFPGSAVSLGSFRAPNLWFQDGRGSCAASHSCNTKHSRICTSLLTASTTGPSFLLAITHAQGCPELNRAMVEATQVNSASGGRGLDFELGTPVFHLENLTYRCQSVSSLCCV